MRDGVSSSRGFALLGEYLIHEGAGRFFYVMPICEVERFVLAGELSEENSCVVASSSPVTKSSKILAKAGALLLEYFDVEEAKRGLRPVQARRVAAYVRAKMNCKNIVTCCTHGKSRSPALMAAILHGFGCENASRAVLEDERFSPNIHVCKLVCEAFDI